MGPQHAPSHRLRRITAWSALTAALPFLGALVIAAGAAHPSRQEREFKSTIPGHVPIKVKVKNEQSFKRMDNKDWARELEVEVRNTGTKPIYYLSVGILMPEVLVDGYPAVFQMRYGRPDLVDFDTSIIPEDVPLKPGENVTLKISVGQVSGYEKARDKDHLPTPKKVEFYLKVLNFGDGTGLTGVGGAPMPDPNRNRLQSRICPNGGPSPPGVRETGPPDLFQRAFYTESPATLLRVNFYPRT